MPVYSTIGYPKTTNDKIMQRSSPSLHCCAGQPSQCKSTIQAEPQNGLRDATIEDILAILDKIPLHPLALEAERCLEISQFFTEYLGFSGFFNRCSPDQPIFLQRKNELLDLALEFIYVKKNIEAAHVIGRCLAPCETEHKEKPDCWHTYYEQDHYFDQDLSEPKIDFVKCIKNAADRDRKVAQFVIGKMHLQGKKNVAQDTKTASAYLQRSVAQGYQPAVDALKELLKLKAENKNERVDIDNDLSLLKEFALEGNANAMFTLGEAHLAANSVFSAIKYFEMADKAQHPEAPFQLSKIYDSEYQNCKFKSLNHKLLEKAIHYNLKYLNSQADKGDANTQRELGKLYLLGTSPLCPQNIKKSEHYLKLAAKEGDGDANYTLFEQYESGNFVSLHPEKLVAKHLAAAAKTGLRLALNLLEQKAVENSDASYELYPIYAEGNTALSLPPNKQKAESYLFMAATMENLQAITLIIRLSNEGKIQSDLPIDDYYLLLHQLQERSDADIKKQIEELLKTGAAEKTADLLNRLSHQDGDL